MSKSIFHTVFFAAVLAIASVAAGQEFTLILGTRATEASISGNTLEIVDSGRLHTYQRDSALDSADGQLIGFYDQKLRKSIRFPASGYGKMQTIDSSGNWSWTLMRVQPRNAAPTMPTAPVPRPHRVDAIDNRIGTFLDIVENLTRERKPKHVTRRPPAPHPKNSNPFVGSWKITNADGSGAKVKFKSNQFTITEVDDFGDEVGTMSGRYKAFKKSDGSIGMKISDDSGNFSEAEAKTNKDKSKLKFWGMVWNKS